VTQNLTMNDIWRHMSLISRSCKNDHIIFNVGTPSLEDRNMRLVNIITYIIEESKLISENMSPNVIHC
jgi:3-keto-L-gulonate-6-phosphate decarboxylase